MAVQVAWRDQAACKGENLDIFFSENLVDQRHAITRFCQSCPVRQDCFNSADREDFRYSVRAGYLINEYKGGPRRPTAVYKKMLKASTQLDREAERRREVRSLKSKRMRSKDWSHKLGAECSGGHIFTSETMDEYGRCKPCKNRQDRERRARLGKC
jgi:hypothetical protein